MRPAKLFSLIGFVVLIIILSIGNPSPSRYLSLISQYVQSGNVSEHVKYVTTSVRTWTTTKYIQNNSSRINFIIFSIYHTTTPLEDLKFLGIAWHIFPVHSISPFVRQSFLLTKFGNDINNLTTNACTERTEFNKYNNPDYKVLTCYKFQWRAWVNALLKNTAGPSLPIFEENSGTQSPCESVVQYPDGNEFLVFSGCRQHACPEAGVFFLLEPKRKIMNIVMWNANGKTEYYGPNAKALKENDLANLLLEKHTTNTLPNETISSLNSTSTSSISSLFVVANNSEVDMLNLVEAPAGHLSGTFVVSTIKQDGTRSKDEVSNVTGSIYQDNVSLQVDNGILSHPTNVVGKLQGNRLSLTFGDSVVVFHQASQEEYRGALSVLDHTGQNRQQLEVAKKAVAHFKDQVTHLDQDLRSFVKWGNERISRVPGVRTWYADRLRKYTACLNTIKPLAARGIPSWRWQNCVLAMDNDEYNREQMDKGIDGVQAEELDTELGLKKRIGNFPELVADTANSMESVCASHEDELACKQQVAIFKEKIPLEFKDSKPVAEYRAILPKLRKALDDDMQARTKGERKLAAIASEVDAIYKSR